MTEHNLTEQCLDRAFLLARIVASAMIAFPAGFGCAPSPSPSGSSSASSTYRPPEEKATGEMPREVRVIVSDAIHDHASLRVLSSTVNNSQEIYDGHWHVEGSFRGEDGEWNRSKHSFEVDVVRERGTWKLVAALIDDRPVAGDVHALRREVDRVKAKVARATAAERTGSRPDARTWSSADGKFSTEAAFAGVSGGKVRLIKSDGGEVSLALEQLSDADRDWIEERRRKTQ